MVPQLLPPPPTPLPPRKFFASDEDWLLATRRQDEAEAQHDAAMKHREAAIIIEIVLFLIGTAAIFALCGYMFAGVVGAILVPIGFMTFVGLLSLLQVTIADLL